MYNPLLGGSRFVKKVCKKNIYKYIYIYIDQLLNLQSPRNSSPGLIMNGEFNMLRQGFRLIVIGVMCGVAILALGGNQTQCKQARPETSRPQSILQTLSIDVCFTSRASLIIY
jgi:hypothetical protein